MPALLRACAAGSCSSGITLPLRSCSARRPLQVIKRQAATHYGCEMKDLPAPVVMAAGGTGGILYWLAIFPGGSEGWLGWVRAEDASGGMRASRVADHPACRGLVQTCAGWAVAGARACRVEGAACGTAMGRSCACIDMPLSRAALPRSCLCSGRHQVCHDDRQHHPRGAALPLHPRHGARAVGRGRRLTLLPRIQVGPHAPTVEWTSVAFRWRASAAHAPCLSAHRPCSPPAPPVPAHPPPPPAPPPSAPASCARCPPTRSCCSPWTRSRTC